jgi:hypothetical protein
VENPEKSLETFSSAAEKLKTFNFLGDTTIANILFVSRGLKPASQFEMFFQENVPSYTRAEFENNVQQIEEILNELQLIFTKRSYYDEDAKMEATEFSIAKDEHSKEELAIASVISDQHQYEQAMGKAYGIPETAIKAFIDSTCVDRKTLPEEVQNSKELRLANFIPSKDHWTEELQSMKEKIEMIESVLPGYFNTEHE